jgi:hypothetical protein
VRPNRSLEAGRGALGPAAQLNRHVSFADQGRLWHDRRNTEVLEMSTAKEELTLLIQNQPDDSSRDEIVRELAFHVMVARGLADSDAKRTISNEEMGRRIKSWPR